MTGGSLARIERAAFGLAVAGLTLAVSIAAAELTWRLTGHGPIGPLAAAASPAPGAARPEIDLAPIRELAPFGRVVQPAAPAEAVRETSLGLTLRGVLVASDPRRSTAVIEDAEREVGSYRVGDEVAGATVVDVERDVVALDVDGRRETLSFPEAGAKAASGAAAIRAKLTGAGASGSAPAANDPDAVITQYRRRIAQNPQAVLDDLGVEATEDGYRVGGSPSGGVRRAGLKAGDVVARVNGNPVGADVESDRRLFDEIATSGRVRLEVVRDGGTVTLSFPLR